METGSALLLLTIGLFIVIGLAGWAAYLFYRLRRQDDSENMSPYPRENARESIVILARGALQQQVDITEACIRIATLLDHLSLSPPQKANYQAIYTVSNAASYIPRLQQWQDLNKSQRKQFRKEKETLENAHRESLRKAFEALIEHYS